MEVRPGYKHTEIGIIPEDWEISPLEDFTSFISYGFTNPMPTSASGVYMITAKDINHGKIQFDTARLTTEEAYRNLLTAKSRPNEGDILLTKDGTLGRLALVDQKTVCINQSVAILRPNPKTVPRFLKVLLEAPVYQNRMLEDAGGSTIKHIYITIVNRMPVALPPIKAEQEAIAEALSDADALIESLEQLLAKKRQIKQGAMQELLTGKRRLPGFELSTRSKQSEAGVVPEDWNVRSVREIADFANGKPYEGNVTPEGSYSLITLDSIGIDGQLKSKHKKTNVLDGSLIKGDIVSVLSDLAHGNLLGLCDVIPTSGEYVLNQRMGRLRLKVLGDPQFVRLQINARQGHFRVRGQGTSQRHIYRRDFDALKIPFPEPDEQKAISSVVSDMDREIKGIEAKLIKACRIKQGMMQQLLTGRIRLV